MDKFNPKRIFMKSIIMVMVSTLFIASGQAQNIGIGTTTPDASALLELKSSNKGFLLPQVGLTSFSDGTTIPSPAIGLMVFHINKANLNGQGVYYNNGNSLTPNWVKLQSNNDSWSLSGNNVQPGAKLGTINDHPIHFVVFNQQQGRLGSNGNILFGLNSGLNLPLPADFISYNNIAIGNEALLTTSAGTFNIAIGNGAMRDATGGSVNIAIGVNAMSDMQFGSIDNIAIGLSAMRSLTTGIRNLAIGRQALLNNTTGSDNVAIGTDAAISNKANTRLTAVGNFALYNADNRTTGRSTYNTAIGYSALMGSSNTANNTGIRNTAVGDSALASNTSGFDNIGLGVGVLGRNSTGNGNIGIGNRALNNIDSHYNVAIGDSTLSFTGNGNNNVAIGKNAMQFSGPSGAPTENNVALGNGAMRLAHGYYNIAIGNFAMYNGGSSGLRNVAIGDSTLAHNGTGQSNTAVGSLAAKGTSNIINLGNNNTTIGFKSGYSLEGTLMEGSHSNTLLGAETGLNLASGSGNVMLGFRSGYFETGSDKLYIENSNANKDNALIYGDFANDSLLLNAKTINRNLFAVRGAGANTGIEIGYGVFLKDPSAGRIGYALATANTIDFYGGGSSASTRAIKFWSEGGSTFTGPVNVDGFTRLGTAAEAAPRVKMKTITTTTANTANGTVNIAHSLTSSKIISVQAIADIGGGSFVPVAYTYAPELNYNYLITSANIVVVNNASTCAGTSICNKPVKIVITYTE